MSKKFKNLKTGLVEEVFNKEVIKQCEKHTEAWEEVKETSKKENAGKSGAKTEVKETSKKEETEPVEEPKAE